MLGIFRNAHDFQKQISLICVANNHGFVVSRE
ncbi:hypothetical protein A4R44_02970 [Amycolatopsis sp. M39]|uniref:Uncharacterized protein n=1 Tax=Amycolatopsis rubida TaxID=112413 RepID=A0A1I5URI3_9PSEU|nr:hypothetical protein A4R44_02970 [Amycolatopsis sp. M39]SFP97829.1 hypothetical protein SAMN05421854_10865 [Amycolatopsis rubida]